MLERAQAGDAATKGERKANAEANRALNDAVQAQKYIAGGRQTVASGSGSASVGSTPVAPGPKSWLEREREKRAGTLILYNIKLK